MNVFLNSWTTTPAPVEKIQNLMNANEFVSQTVSLFAVSQEHMWVELDDWIENNHEKYVERPTTAQVQLNGDTLPAR